MSWKTEKRVLYGLMVFAVVALLGWWVSGLSTGFFTELGWEAKKDPVAAVRFGLYACEGKGFFTDIFNDPLHKAEDGEKLLVLPHEKRVLLAQWAQKTFTRSPHIDALEHLIVVAGVGPPKEGYSRDARISYYALRKHTPQENLSGFCAETYLTGMTPLNDWVRAELNQQ